MFDPDTGPVTYEDWYRFLYDEFNKLYYRYAQFYSSREGYHVYAGALNEAYHHANQMFSLLMQPMGDFPTFDYLTDIIEELEAKSVEQASAVLRGTICHPDRYLLPNTRPITFEDEAFAKQRMESLRHFKVVVLEGVTECYFETGTEGVYWALADERRSGYDGLFIIENGDFLTLYDDRRRTVYFDGIVIYDRITGWRPYHADQPFGMGQQASIFFNVHWIQKGFSPSSWGRLFVPEGRLKARIIREKEKFPKDIIKAP